MRTKKTVACGRYWNIKVLTSSITLLEVNNVHSFGKKYFCFAFFDVLCSQVLFRNVPWNIDKFLGIFFQLLTILYLEAEVCLKYKEKNRLIIVQSLSGFCNAKMRFNLYVLKYISMQLHLEPKAINLGVFCILSQNIVFCPVVTYQA